MVIETKDEKYFNYARQDLIKLLPSGFKPERVLEIGCGNGNTGEMLKNEYGSTHITGVEIDPIAAAKALEKLNTIIVGNIEVIPWPFSDVQFDLIVLADILEHLVDPWKLVARLQTVIHAEGLILASIPNVQHWRTVLGLLRGNWEYKKAGILDKTHLRFFTFKSVRELFELAGWEILKIVPRPQRTPKLFALFSFGLLAPFGMYQFLLLAKKRVE